MSKTQVGLLLHSLALLPEAREPLGCITHRDIGGFHSFARSRTVQAEMMYSGGKLSSCQMYVFRCILSRR
jgi:hypothetical protein